MNARHRTRLVATAALTVGVLAGVPVMAIAADAPDGQQPRVVTVVRTNDGSVTRFPFNVFGNPGGAGADRVIAPGDLMSTVITVENGTSSPGTLTAMLIDVNTTDNELGDEDRFDYLTLNGTPLSVIARDGQQVTHSGIALGEGESVDLAFDVAFDLQNGGELSNIGNSAFFGVREAEFALQLSIASDPPEVTPAPADPADPTPPAAGTTAPRADTGGILGVNRTGLLWAAGALLAGGLVALIPALRRRKGSHTA